MSKIDWSNYSDGLKENKTFVFFIQRFYELLFDYTLDTFKPRALNTPLLCKEILNIIEEVEKGIIDKNHIEHIFEELKWSYKSDPIAKEIIGERRNDYLENIDLTNLSDLKIKISLLSNRLNHSNYLELAKESMFELVKNNSKEKRKLEKILSSFLTGILDLGYSKSSVYRKFRSTFISPNEHLEDEKVIDDFFDNFSYANNSYLIVFKGHKIFEKFKDSCDTFRLEITNDLSDYSQLSGISEKESEFLKSKRDNQIYIVAKSINSLDSESARILANKRIEKISNLFVFFHHKKTPTWNPRGLVCKKGFRNEFEASELINEPTPVLHKTFDLIPSRASIELKNVLKNFGLESSSFKRFDTAIDLHASAMANTDLESQLLNLWISLETLIKPRNSKPKIDNYIQVLSTFLVYRYTEKIFKYVSKLLLSHKAKTIKDLVIDLDSDLKLYEKIAAVIVCDDLKEKKNSLIEQLEDSPLLKYRIQILNKEFCNGKNILDFIENHKFKVSKQLRRIYRTRNLIVHSGRSPSFSENLTENLHNYVDTFLKTILDLNLENRKINTIEEGCLEIELTVNRHLEKVKASGEEKLQSTNFKSILFSR